MMFKVAGHDTIYQVVSMSKREAIDVGCPDDTHRLIGEHLTCFGRMFPSGRPKGGQVQVPDMARGTYGVRMNFVSDGLNDSPLVGYLID